jgi:hypothetical protein
LSSTTRTATGASGVTARRNGGGQPRRDGGDQLGGVDRLGDVVVGSGLDAALALARHDLSGYGDDREVREPVDGPDRSHRGIAVHPRHHDVHQDDLDLGRPLEQRDGVGAALSDADHGAAALEQGGQREDVAVVVVDDEELDPVERGEVMDLRRRQWRSDHRNRRGRSAGSRGALRLPGGRQRVRREGRRRRGLPRQRQVDGEPAAMLGRRGHRDLPAEQGGQLAADRQAEARAPVKAGRRPVSLHERLEDPLLVLLRDADPGIPDADGQCRRGTGERAHVGVPARLGGPELDAHLALCGELERVGEEILEDLTQALGVGDDGLRGVRGQHDRETEPLGLGHLLEVPEQGAAELLEGDVDALHRHGSGLDLRQLEDAVEQLEQVVARREDHPRVLDLGRRHGAVRVVLELLGQDEEAVERRAQLV